MPAIFELRTTPKWKLFAQQSDAIKKQTTTTEKETGPGRASKLNGDSFLGFWNKERTKVQPPPQAGHQASSIWHLAHVAIAVLFLDRNLIFLTQKWLLQPAAPQTRSPRGHKALKANTKNGIFRPNTHWCQFSPSLSPAFPCAPRLLDLESHFHPFLPICPY